MKVSDREYCKVEVHYAVTPTEYEPEVKVEDGVVWVKAKWENGNTVWVRADSLRGHREAKEEALAQLLREVWRIQACHLNLSKAEMKRRMIKEGIISK